MKFSEITGHQQIISSLQNVVESGKIPHALLFTGKSGIGKFRTARALAQYIHCKNPKNGDACGKCSSCLQHQNFNNPDLHFVFPILKKDGASVSKNFIDIWRTFLSDYSYMPWEQWNELLKAGNSQPAIFVDESEEIISRASLSPFQENLKIFIVWLPEKMRTEAANKLLKIIEEPFEDTLFILVSNDDSGILPTILSRTRRINFHPLKTEEIKNLLIEKGVEPAMAEDAARIAGGSLQKAEELAIFPEEIQVFSRLFKEIMRNAYALKAKNLKEISEEIAAFGREKIIRFISYAERMIRENFIYNFHIQSLNEMTSEEENFSRNFSPFIHPGNVEKISFELDRAKKDIGRNGNSKIILFDLFLLLSRLVRMPKSELFPNNFSV